MFQFRKFGAVVQRGDEGGEECCVVLAEFGFQKLDEVGDVARDGHVAGYGKFRAGEEGFELAEEGGGWALGTSLATSLVTEALARAQKKRRPWPGLLHHSDRGVQYASSAYRALLAHYQITPSMSRAANPYDNALAESFMATFKTECFDHTPATRSEARLMVFDYLETFYNPKRLHSALGYQSPVEFEKQFN
jgi:hypothetical protein